MSFKEWRKGYKRATPETTVREMMEQAYEAGRHEGLELAHKIAMDTVGGRHTAANIRKQLSLMSET